MAEFDFIRTPIELTMICYFWKSLKFYIKVEIEQQNWELANFKEMEQKTINTKTKADLRFSIMVWDSDIYCSKNHRFSNSTTSKI